MVEISKKEKNDNENISSMKIILKKMVPVVGIYFVVNAANLYYHVYVIKIYNYNDILNPVFLISSAIYWIVYIHYEHKYGRRSSKKEVVNL